MHITLLANRDLHSNYALNLLLPQLANDHSLTLFLSDTVGGDSNRQPDLHWLQFLEQTLCNDLLFPTLDRTGITGELLTFSAFERFLEQPWARLNDPNSVSPASIARKVAITPRYCGSRPECKFSTPRDGRLMAGGCRMRP